MNNKSTAIQRIDWVLKWFSKSGFVKDGAEFDFIYKKLVELHPELNEESDWGIELIKILNKLISDGYIEFIPEERTKTIGFTQVILSKEKYRITFDGDFFCSSGGYAGQHRQNNLAERRVRISQILTWILAVGVVTPSLWNLFDILRNYYNPLLIPFRNYVLPFLLLIAGILLLLYLIKHLPKQNKNK